jgi:type IV pili sensor histidine kinase/response regulator
MPMKTLNPEVLLEIAVETRQCFLREDAPSYLANLQKGLAQIEAGQPNYIFLMHAAHSLKGGSAIAELLSLSKLAHKLEDMLEILQHNEFCDRTTIAEVLSHGIDEVASVLAQASNLPSNALTDIKIDLELLQRLDSLLAIVKSESKTTAQNQLISESISESPNQPKSTISAIIISSLEKDLEACIKQVEAKLFSNSTNLSETVIREELQYFCEECLLLGDTLRLKWLIDIVEPFESQLQQEQAIVGLLSKVQVVISSLRSQRLQYLYPESTSAELPPQVTTEPFAETIAEKTQPEELAIATVSAEAISYLRIPSSQIESMTNIVAEMILRHERLLRQQQQLGRTIRIYRLLYCR